MALFTLLSSANPNRIFGLDVLRAFAIVTVMIGHSSSLVSEAWLPYYELFWFDGVAIFFVLSGFLIGRVLLKTLRDQLPSWPVLLHFMGRRWLRTIPAYVVALSVLFLLQTGDPAFRLTHYKSYYIFLQNFNWPLPGIYPESWSLSVEEWFYLLLPSVCFMLVAARLRPQMALLGTALSVILLVTWYRYYKFEQVTSLTWDEWDSQFRCIVLLRLDAPMYGVLGAYIAHYNASFWKSHRAVKLWLGIGLLCFVNFTFYDHAFASHYMTVFYFPLTSLAVLLMLPFLNEWKASVGLVPRVVTQVSMLSYSLYLVHGSLVLWTVITPHLAYLPGTPATEKALGLLGFWVLSWLVAWALYTWVELPFIRLRSRLNILLPHKRALVRTP